MSNQRRHRRLSSRRSSRRSSEPGEGPSESWGMWCIKNRLTCQALGIFVAIIIGMLLLWWFCSTELGGPLCSIMSGLWAALKWVIGAVGSVFSAIIPG